MGINFKRLLFEKNPNKNSYQHENTTTENIDTQDPFFFNKSRCHLA